MQCPSDDIISDYLQGQLSIAGRSQADEHLDQCQECRSLSSELARSTATLSGSEPDGGESLPGIGPGVLIAGKYEVLEEIATGGMGVVYLAQQAGLNRTVAIKLMRASVAGSVDAAIRFTREARIAAQLASPHIVNVLDIGLTEDGLPFIVMEHLKGHDLEHHLTKKGPLAIDEATDLVRQICRGLYEAHNHGIVHRDLKPGNIFLVSESSGGHRAVLLDFGVSKMTGQSEVGLTQTGMIMGSPRYMSPEQLADSKSVDHRSDIWSLGVILYEVLAGIPPYKSTTLVQLVAEILQGGALIGLAILSLFLFSKEGPADGGQKHEETTSVPATAATVKAEKLPETRSVEPLVLEAKPVEPKVPVTQAVEAKVPETKTVEAKVLESKPLKKPSGRTGHSSGIKAQQPTPKVNKGPATTKPTQENDDDAILNIPL